MRKRKDSIREIIQAKAEFLIYTRVEIAQRLEHIRSLRAQAGEIPTNRAAGRSRAYSIREEANRLETILSLELGGSVIRTFAFIMLPEHKKYLTKKLKKELCVW